MTVQTNVTFETYRHDVINAAGMRLTLVDFTAGPGRNQKQSIIETIAHVFGGTFDKTLDKPIYGTFRGMNPVACRKGVTDAAYNDKPWHFHDQIFSAAAAFPWSADGAGGTNRVQVWVLHPSGTGPNSAEQDLPAIDKAEETGLKGAVKVACEICVTNDGVRGLVATLAKEK